MTRFGPNEPILVIMNITPLSRGFFFLMIGFLTLCSGVCLFLFMRVRNLANAEGSHNWWLSFWGAGQPCGSVP